MFVVYKYEWEQAYVRVNIQNRSIYLLMKFIRRDHQVCHKHLRQNGELEQNTMYSVSLLVLEKKR